MSEQEIEAVTLPQTSKTEIIAKIAKALKDQRASRGLTLDKVGQTIKIRLPYLEAIESGDWDQLPGEVFVRGFIRRYAGYLGMDGDKLIAPYITLVDSPVEKKNTSSNIPENPSEFGRTQLLWAFLGVVFIIGFLKVIKQDRSAPVPAPKTPPVAVAQSSPVVENVAPALPQKIDVPQPILAKHQIEVFSPFPLWLRVTASDKNFEGFIPQSASWTWRGEGEFSIRLGHTKQVTLIFDGKTIPLAEEQKKITLPIHEN